jgi:primary-amine oxidase
LDTLTRPALHPLDPLTLEEIGAARALVAAHPRCTPTLRFALVELLEPPLAEGRAARITTLDRGSGAVGVVIADLARGRIAEWRDIPADRPPFGQPPILLEEFLALQGVVKSDPRWIAAVKRRGITEADLPLVQIDPFSAGWFPRPNEAGRRLVRAVAYWREAPKDNGYAHPIEGVVAVVDLNAASILELWDDPLAIPVPRRKANYHREALPPPRRDLKPLHVQQPEGASFTVDGWQVAWQGWRFRIGYSPREGLVLHDVSVQGRSVIRRASIAEMVVPYADPGTNHFWKSAFDAGEYGLGKMANALELGCDCLGLIRYFDIPAADDHGNPVLLENAVCLHEEDYGILWKHFEFRTGTHEVRRSRRLVISFFATVGNYDYGFYWYLYQDGTIQLEAKLSGIIQTAAVMPGERYAWGGMVMPELGGPTHQHLFCARLHMAVDGSGNSVTEHEFHPRPWGADNPHGNVFDTTSRILARELDACREAEGRTGRFWKIINPSRTNAVGNSPGYKLTAQAAPPLLAQPGSTVHARGTFATKHLWVTRYAPEERFPAGDFPNQHAGGDGLPRWVQQNRSIENTDIVVWHSFGHTHVCKPEDFPVMPVEYAGFTLKPSNFFDANPAMDLPPGADPHSLRDGAGPDCCG